MRRRTIGAALTAGLMILTGTPASAYGRPDAAVQARVWVTTPDRAELLHERAPGSG
jgi:glucosylceramidase